MARIVQSNALPNPASPSNLPLQLTSFIGRVQEIAQLQEWLVQAPRTGARLLTLTGAGGCGKTRLALEVASALAPNGPFPDGIWLVELAALNDGQLVEHAVASTLQIREQSNQPLAAILAATLQSRQLLLILDNCEHLIEACAGLVETLLRNCPRLTILATSREALNIAGERLWLVLPLAVPTLSVSTLAGNDVERGALASLLQVESVQLFIERASAVQAAFALTMENAEAVVQICRWLDGIPLAIELAAGRIKTLSPAQIAERLDQRLTLLTAGSRTALARHQTLRATVDWSYELLAEAERTLLRRLSLFSGGWTLSAAEAICADNDLGGQEQAEEALLPASSILDLLARLVDKSLVIKQEQGQRARYFMLETIKQYGSEKLIASGNMQAFQQRHALYFALFAEQIEPKINTAERKEWMMRLDVEHDNLRGALRWARNVGEVKIALRLAGALYWYWHHRGFWQEGRGWLQDAVQMAVAQPPTSERAKSLLGLGWLAFIQADAPTAHSRLAQSVADARIAGDAGVLAYALSFLALASTHQGDLPNAHALAVEAVERMRQLDNRWGLALALLNRGIVAEAEADFEVAYTVLQESAALFAQEKDDWAVSLPLRHMGIVAFRQGNPQQAEELCKRSLGHLRHYDDKWLFSMSLDELAGIAVIMQRYERAARLMGAAEALREAIGTGIRQLYRQDHERTVDLARTHLGNQRFESLWQSGRALTLDAAIAAALEEEAPLPEPVAHTQTPPAPPRASSSASESLVIHAFGSARVQLGERLLTASDWSFAKPKELLFYLLSYPQRTKEQIGLVFWPDASPSQLRNNLHSTLYQMRQALGRPDWIVFAHQAYAFNRSLDYFYDVEDFEKHLAQSKGHLQAPQERQLAIQHLQAAMHLAEGNFAEDLVAGDWIFAKREELQQSVLTAAMTLGQLLMEEQAYQEAAAVYRQAIAWDDLLEEAHRALIVCHARMGERAQALRHYQTLRDLLWNELQIEPDHESVLLMQRLQQGESV